MWALLCVHQKNPVPSQNHQCRTKAVGPQKMHSLHLLTFWQRHLRTDDMFSAPNRYSQSLFSSSLYVSLCASYLHSNRKFVAGSFKRVVILSQVQMEEGSHLAWKCCNSRTTWRSIRKMGSIVCWSLRPNPATGSFWLTSTKKKRQIMFKRWARVP